QTSRQNGTDRQFSISQRYVAPTSGLIFSLVDRLAIQTARAFVAGVRIFQTGQLPDRQVAHFLYPARRAPQPPSFHLPISPAPSLPRAARRLGVRAPRPGRPV